MVFPTEQKYNQKIQSKVDLPTTLSLSSSALSFKEFIDILKLWADYEKKLQSNSPDHHTAQNGAISLQSDPFKNNYKVGSEADSQKKLGSQLPLNRKSPSHKETSGLNTKLPDSILLIVFS